MTVSIFLQFMVVLAAIWMGARSSGIGLGLWGAVGLTVLIGAFGITPTSPPIDVMLIILAVIMAASVMEAAGGIDFLVGIAERIIRANPKYVTIVAPLTTWTFTFLAGTGHIVYPLLPVIYETAHRSGIRPERPMAVATIASQQAITASPVAAATAAMIGLFAEKGLTEWGLREILLICVPATLIGVVAAAIVSMFMGKDLKDDKVYQARLAAGEIPAPQAPSERPALKPTAKLAAFVFLTGVALVVLFGFFPELRKLPGAKSPLGMPIVIEILMMSVAAIMLLVTKVAVDEVPKTATDTRPQQITRQTLSGVTTSPESIALSKDLRKRGWSFVGPTTMYAFMQAMGLVNDHIEGCAARAKALDARAAFKSPALIKAP